MERSSTSHRARRLVLAAGVVCASGGQLVGTAPASAFDGQRTGFLLGLSGGLMTTDVSVFDDPDGPDGDYAEGNDVGGALKLTIGGGITERFALSGTHVFGRFRIDGTEHWTYLLGVTATTWLRRSAPSPYGSLTLARQSIRTSGRGFFGTEAATGYALRIAAGFEFANRLHVEAGFTRTDTGGYRRDSGDVDTNQWQVLGGWHWY